jgi:biopolymer transport protein ExbD
VWNTLLRIHERHTNVADRDALTIACEDEVVYDKIVKLMDIARHAGFAEISIARLRAAV